MSKIRKLFNQIGLAIKLNDNVLDNEICLEYLFGKPKKNRSKEKLLLHRDFLKSLELEEINRLTLIENKTMHMIAQTSVIFALLSLAIPLIVDKIGSVSFKLFLFISLLSAFLFYLLTIYNAIKNFNVKNFKYSRSLPTNVITFEDASIEEFLIEEINDLLYSTRTNTRVNNEKASNLIYSYNCFKVAIMLTALVGMALLCVSLFL